ncbi:hypothetical protein ACFTZI_26920 [Streptomyces decoyicus]|uniref:hypothetical protein n=1 Tax=Streptomyces decoyicus TaxID=249567 RepID=UPI003641E664
MSRAQVFSWRHVQLSLPRRTGPPRARSSFGLPAAVPAQVAYAAELALGVRQTMPDGRVRAPGARRGAALKARACAGRLRPGCLEAGAVHPTRYTERECPLAVR